MLNNHTYEMLDKKPRIVLSFLWLLPLTVLLLFLLLAPIVSLNNVNQFTIYFLLCLLPMIPALVYGRHVKNIHSEFFYELSNELPNPLRLTYDLPLAVSYSVFWSICLVILLGISVFVYFSYSWNYAIIYFATAVFVFFTFLRHFRYLKNPDIMTFSPTEITSQHNETYVWDDVKRVEIKKDKITFDLSNENSFDAVLVLFDETDRMGFYQAIEYVMTYANKDSFKSS